MNGKQNLIFFLGLTLLIVSFVASGNWNILWNATFRGGAPSSGIGSGNPIKAKNKHCPKGYHFAQGYCWPPIIQNPPL